MTEITMEAFLTEVGKFFTQSVTWLGDVLDVVVQNPALLALVICMPICGFAIGMLGRLVRL